MQTTSTNQHKFNNLVKQKNSLNKRILRIVSLAVFVLLSCFLASDYYTTINHVEKLTLDRLQGVVKSLAVQIDGDQHVELTDKFSLMGDISYNQQEENYKKIHTILAQAYVNHDLNSPIYTFVKTEDDSKNLQFITTSSQEPYYRHTYTSLPDEAFARLEDGGKIGLYKDEFGHWLSSFAPIKNSRGEIVAFVQADEKFDHFINDVRAKSMRNALLSFGAFTIVILFLFPYLKQVLKEEDRQKTILKKALEKTQRLSKELEKNEEALTENAKKLEQSNKDLTDFAHIASHDLKTPIRNIASFAQLLQRQKRNQLDDAANEYLDFISQSAERAQKLIQGLLSYSTADKDLGEQTVFYMCDAVREATINLTSVVDEQKAKIVFEKLITIRANSTLIAQVLQNLINNGIKYNQSKTPVIHVGTKVDLTHGRCFYVKDNGIGIPKEYQKDIFKMFTRLHSTQEYEGSGIGLAFCNRVIGAYGGKMWLESSEEEGSTFYFTLPNAVVKAAPVMA